MNAFAAGVIAGISAVFLGEFLGAWSLYRRLDSDA